MVGWRKSIGRGVRFASTPRILSVACARDVGLPRVRIDDRGSAELWLIVVGARVEVKLDIVFCPDAKAATSIG